MNLYNLVNNSYQKTLFKIKPDGSIDKTCIPCRSIPTNYNSKMCVECDDIIPKVNFELNEDGTISDKQYKFFFYRVDYKWKKLKII